MEDRLYANKSGFKCVWSQLAKTDGRDPQEFEEVQRQARNNGWTKVQIDTEVAKLKVRAPEFQ